MSRNKCDLSCYRNNFCSLVISHPYEMTDDWCDPYTVSVCDGKLNFGQALLLYFRVSLFLLFLLDKMLLLSL